MFKKNKLGFYFEDEYIYAQFGNRHSNFESLQVEFPKYEFIRMKQTHSDLLAEVQLSDDLKYSVDALKTREHGLALCCSTADCMPILVYDSATSTIYSIHAGWRGVANQILQKATAGADYAHLTILIGPHIQMKSFEVGNDVRDQILANRSSVENFYETISSEKSKVDLLKIVTADCLQLGIHAQNIHVLNRDTFTDFEFHSHRRDREKSGRQLSFIVLK